MSSELIAALSGAVAGGMAVVAAVAGVFRYAIRAELDSFELKLLAKLGGAYAARTELTAVEKRLAMIEEHGCRFRRECD